MTTLATGSSTEAKLKKAVHHHRLASRRGLLERMFTLWFRGFVYNQIWEDPRVDAEALRLDSDSSLLTISSGGCNVLNYLVHQPKRIVAVDLNDNHMCLTRLKLAAVKHLPDYESFYQFFGYGQHRDNLALYHKFLRDKLDPVTRTYWESTDWPGKTVGPKRISYFKRGLYNQAKLGQFFRVVHGLARQMGRDPARLLTARSQEEQEQLFEEYFGPLFNNRIVRWMGRQPVAVYSLGIPPSQHAAMLEESGGNGQKLFDTYRERIKRLACGFPLDDNYFTWQAFGRQYDHENRKAIPDYLKEENFDIIRSVVDRVETHIASLGEYLEKAEPGSLNRFVLLDSQDWMPPDVIENLWRLIARVGDESTRVIFRTAGERSPVEDSLSSETAAHFSYNIAESKRLHPQDRSAIYGMFHLYEKTTPTKPS